MVLAMDRKTILLAAGGDERFAGLCRLLAEKQLCTIYTLGFGDKLEDVLGLRTLTEISELRHQPDMLVLPLPLTADGVHLRAPFHTGSPILLRYLLDLCHKGTRVYCGKADEAFRAECRERGLPLCDYLDDEAFTVKNAAATAEAAVTLACGLRRKTLFGSRVLVLGGGRIAKSLCRLLIAYGARVFCAARSPEQRVWADLSGAEGVPLNAIPEPERIDLVFSTVPRTVFGEAELTSLRRDCLLIELGSLPGGIDEKAAGHLGRPLVRALSLPGKTVPDSASEWLAELILEKEAETCEKN